MSPPWNQDQIIQKIHDLLKEEAFSEALEICNQILAKSNDGIILHLKGLALYCLERFQEAIVSFTEATQQPNFTVESWSYLALLQLEMLNLEQAKIAILRATQISPYQADIWAIRAIYREWLQDFQGAERAYDHAHWLAPDIIPKFPKFQPEQITEELTNILLQKGFTPEDISEIISIQFQLAPTLSQLEDNLHVISPLYLSFHFEQNHQRGILIGFEKNILRSLAEDVSVEKQLEPILPQLEHYLETWYQRQP